MPVLDDGFTNLCIGTITRGRSQIRKYSEVNNDLNLMHRLDEISSITKDVKERIYHLLVNEFKYFE